MIWHSSTLKELNDELQTNFDKGLSDAIANFRLKEFDDNFSSTVSVTPFWSKLLATIKQPINLLLLISAVIFYSIELIMPAYDKEHLNIALFVIAFTVIFSVVKALISFISEKIIANEQKITAPKAVVIRGGVEKTINSTEIVPGDLIVLRHRYSVPADARLIKTENLICNESAITGINVPTVKDSSFVCTDITPLPERANMVYAGSWVSHGFGLAIVTETGDETEFGKKIAIDRKPALSDIDDSLLGLKKMLSLVSVYVAIFSFIIIGLITRFSDSSINLTLLSIATHVLLVSSAISILLSPVSISEISSLTTVIGLLRLKKHNVSVTNADVLDEMGNVNCVCVDKSAITAHDMTATEIYNGIDVIDITNGVSNDTAMLLRLAAAASLDEGDTTDKAIISACLNSTNISKADIDNLYPRLSYVPFDHSTMTTVSVNMIDGQPYAIVKGAAETVACFCSGDGEHIINSAEAMGTKALHVIAVAVKVLSNVSDTVNPSKDELFGGLTFLGLIGFADPIKNGIRESVNECLDAGINVMLFTGDSLATAKAIGRQAGILSDDQQAILGCEMENLNDDDLLDVVKSHTVFARINPTLRNRIVQLLNKSGYVLAATGRSPKVSAAMDSANIGCALGNTSSDAVKRTADVILNDDSFTSITSMIKAGRNIFNNIRCSICSIFTVNIALVIFELFGYFIWQKSLLTSFQMICSSLIINLIIILLISFEPYSKLNNVGEVKSSNMVNLNYEQKINVAWQSIIIAVASLVAYGVTISSGVNAANTACLLVFITSSVISLIGFRTNASIISSSIISNKVCFISIIAVFLISFIFAANSSFGISGYLPILILLALIPLISIELVKIIKQYKRSK